MDPLTLGAIGAALGLGKGLLIDQPAADRDRQVQAVTARYSPWTGMRPTPVKEADPFGNALQGGLTGAAFGQGMQQTKNMNSLMDSQKAMMDRMGTPTYQPGMGMGMYANSVPNGYSPWLRMGY